MKDFWKWLWIAIIIIIIAFFWTVYIYRFIECASMDISEMPWYCIYILNNN